MNEVSKGSEHNLRIKQIFDELQHMGFIKPDRILKPQNGDRLGFSAYPFLPFRNGIYYGNKISGLSDNSLRFFLLHEEGHIIKSHFGCLLRYAIVIIGFLIFAISLFLAFLFQSVFNFNFLQSCIVYGLGMFLGLFLMFISTGLSINSLQMDEYESDIYAAKKIQEKFSNERPSEILKTAFIEMKGYFDSYPESHHSPLKKIFLAVQEYHPTEPQRIEYVKFWVDKGEEIDHVAKKLGIKANIDNHSIDYKSFLDSPNQRSQFLGNLIPAINGIFLPFILAFFTVAMSTNHDVRIPVVFISILFVWRYYVQLVDTEIIDVYRRIIYCQEKMGICDEEISLKGILKRQKENRWFFNRGQTFFDLCTGLIMIAILIGYFWPYFTSNYQYPEVMILFGISVIEIVLFIIFSVQITCKNVREINILIK